MMSDSKILYSVGLILFVASCSLACSNKRSSSNSSTTTTIPQKKASAPNGLAQEPVHTPYSDSEKSSQGIAKELDGYYEAFTISYNNYDGKCSSFNSLSKPKQMQCEGFKSGFLRGGKNFIDTYNKVSNGQLRSRYKPFASEVTKKLSAFE